MNPDVSGLTPISEIRGEDPEETVELREMYGRARSYLESHSWCEALLDGYLGFGVGGVVAVFLFHVQVRGRGTEWLWVVEGDLPSAYLVTDRAHAPRQALEVYVELIEAWIRAARSGSGLKGCFPLRAPADEEHARMLEDRVKLLRRDIIPAAD